MTFIRERIRVGILMLIGIILVTSCSDKDYYVPEVPPGEKQIKEVLKELDKVEGVEVFAKALENASSTIGNIQEERLTVFAAKNFVSTRSAEETLKRHIVIGARDIINFSADTLKLQTLSDEQVYITKADHGQVLVNGIPLAQDKRIAAGNSYIYIMSGTLPTTEVFMTPKYEVTFKVLECNTSWSPDNNAETFPSDDALIRIYKKNSVDDYIVIDSVKTDATGYASFKHNYTIDLYYTIENGDFYSKSFDYIPVGVFTTQAEIDTAPQYDTGTLLDDLELGSLKLADLNGDMLINESDRYHSDYFMIDQEAEEVVVYLIPPGSGFSGGTYFETTEDLINALNGLKDIYLSFLSLNYDVDHKLTKGDANYPSLSNLTEAETMWGLGWQYIHNYLAYRYMVMYSFNNRLLLKEWNKHLIDAEFAYIYLTLINYYGDIPLFTEPQMGPVWDIMRTPQREIIEFIGALSTQVSVPNFYAIRALLARYYVNINNYQSAQIYAEDIINAGGYSLVSDPLQTVSNNEVLMGGYVLPSDNKILHAILYREVILLAAESAFELGDSNKALMYVNQIQKVNGQAEYSNVTRDIIRNLWSTEFANQAMGYMFLNRWGTLLDVLGTKGAQSHNNLLPIPSRDILNSNMQQNPGY